MAKRTVYVTGFEQISIEKALEILNEIDIRAYDERIAAVKRGLTSLYQKTLQSDQSKKYIDAKGIVRKAKRVPTKKELELDWQIGKYIEEHGTKGFTNDQIKAHFRHEPLFLRLWNNRKAKAAVDKHRGADYELFHREGFWYKHK